MADLQDNELSSMEDSSFTFCTVKEYNMESTCSKVIQKGIWKVMEIMIVIQVMWLLKVPVKYVMKVLKLWKVRK